MKNTRLRLLIATLILIPVLVYWGFTGTPSEHSGRSSGNQGVDYFMNGVTTISYDETGIIKQATDAIRVEHYPDKALNQLESPQVRLYREHGLPVRINALTAHIGDNQEVVTLEGNVQVINNTASGQRSRLTTQWLSVFPEKQTAETHAKVTLLSGNSIMQATGMKADFNSSRVELLSDVKGQHTNAQ